VDGDPGPETRQVLFLAYMDFVCSDDQNQPFKLQKADFLARGADPGGKGDFQGCGEFNPAMVFSDKEHKEFSKAQNHPARNVANAVNRRVLAFLFRAGTIVEPKLWPCPRATEPTTDCRKRLWSDGEDRRGKRLPDERREFKKTEDTFACRFYHGITIGSPCEATIKLLVVRLLIDGPENKRIPVKNRRFAVVMGPGEGSTVKRGRTDAEGILRLQVFDKSVPLTLKIDAGGLLTEDPPQSGSAGSSGNSQPQAASSTTEPPEGGPNPWKGEDKFRQYRIKDGGLLPVDAAGNDPLKQRLHNLGYGRDDLSTWDDPMLEHAVKAFQRDNKESGLSETGNLDQTTKDAIKAKHGS